ncbi:MAG TPA: rhodanese-like domain-containing protein [Bryobacteraceae bacterium]|nr:rhodanese-like domain-containing protein [Bryobacteraceae bacterium]
MLKRTLIVAIASLAAALGADVSEIQPKDLAAQLQSQSSKPVVLQVGFNVLYRSKHIPGAIYAGPASKPEGLDALKAAVAKLPRDREIVLYCGCCPWDKCPNIRPALASLREMGFTHVRALMIPTNFAADWVDHGYPVEEGKAAK